MPFTQIAQDVADRLQEARKSQANIKRMEDDFVATRVADPMFAMSKGLQFVALYAAVEFALTRVSERYLAEVMKANPPRTTLVAGILSIGLNSFFQSAADQSGMKKLQRRAETVAESRVTSALNLTLVAPAAELQACSGTRVEEIWALLHLPGSPYSKASDRPMLNEIFERRCAAAHGRESLSQVGASTSAADLQVRLEVVERVCNAILGAATSGLQSGAYR